MSDENDIFGLANVEDIPPELLRSLKVSKRDELETRLIELFSLAGRPLTLDEVLVGYFRKFKEVLDRRILINKLYTMHRNPSPSIEAVPERKGVYKIRQGFARASEGSPTQIEEEDAPLDNQ